MICISSPRFTATTCPGIGASFAFAGASRTAADLARQDRLDVAHGHRQKRLLVVRQHALQDAEVGGEFRERRILVGAHAERERARVGEQATRVVLQAVGNLDPELLLLGQARAEGHALDAVAGILRQLRGYALPAASTRRIFCASRLGDRRGERKRKRQDRDALRILVHALAGERGAKRRPHLEGERLHVARDAPPSWRRCPCPRRASLRHWPGACARRRASPAANRARRAGAGTCRGRCPSPAGGTACRGCGLRWRRGTGRAGSSKRTTCGCRESSCARRRSTRRTPISSLIAGGDATRVRRDRLGLRRRVEPEDEHLVLVDRLPSYGRLRRIAGPPVVNSKRCPPATAPPSTSVNPVFTVNAATHARRQVAREVVHPVARVGPAPGALFGALDGERIDLAWIAERHHRLGEACGDLAHALYLAARAEQFDGLGVASAANTASTAASTRGSITDPHAKSSKAH